MNKGNIDNQLRAIFLGQFPSRNHCDQVKHGIVITEGGEGIEDHLQQEEERSDSERCKASRRLNTIVYQHVMRITFTKANSFFRQFQLLP